MPDYRAQYAAPAWLLTRELIGQELRTLYELPAEWPPRLLALAKELGRLDANPLPELPVPLQTLIRKLDELEASTYCVIANGTFEFGPSARRSPFSVMRHQGGHGVRACMERRFPPPVRI